MANGVTVKNTKDLYIGNAIYMSREDMLNDEFANNFLFVRPTLANDKVVKSININYEMSKKNVYLDEKTQWDLLYRQSLFIEDGETTGNLTIDHRSRRSTSDSFYLKIVICEPSGIHKPTFYEIYKNDKKTSTWVYESNCQNSDSAILTTDTYGIQFKYENGICLVRNPKGLYIKYKMFEENS